MLTFDPRFPKLVFQQFIDGNIRFLLSINFKKEDIETLISQKQGIFEVDLHDIRSKHLYRISNQNLKGKYLFSIIENEICFQKLDENGNPFKMLGADGKLQDVHAKLRERFKNSYYINVPYSFYPISGCCCAIILNHIFL